MKTRTFCEAFASWFVWSFLLMAALFCGAMVW